MERFCDELRWEREQRKVSIEAICEQTKVSPRHLRALEAGEYSELPGGVFRKGIVRSYLAALGLGQGQQRVGVFDDRRFEAVLGYSHHRAAHNDFARFDGKSAGKSEDVRQRRPDQHFDVLRIFHARPGHGDLFLDERDARFKVLRQKRDRSHVHD